MEPLLQLELGLTTFGTKTFHVPVYGIVARFLIVRYGRITTNNGTDVLLVAVLRTEPVAIALEGYVTIVFRTTRSANRDTIYDNDKNNVLD
jgi:hypothetical protein